MVQKIGLWQPYRDEELKRQKEVTETSGRLHPLWPQNKRLRTPWTADWMHTRQDRWIDGTSFYTCKECHQTESLWNHITTDHKEREQVVDRRNVSANSCNSGDGTDQKVQSLMFMMMMMSDMWLSTTKCIVVIPLQQWLRERATMLLYVV